MNTSIYYNQARLGSALGRTPGKNGGQSIRTFQKGILVVEDDATVREFLRMILGAEGYQVFEADSEAQALKIWHENYLQIDLLLTDVCIPYQTTGVDLARKFRLKKPWLKVIYTSGFSPDIVAADGIPLVVNVNFICKPYPGSKLLEVLKNAFAESTAPSSN